MLGQLNSSFSCELNGVTWFLIALFIMHLLTDVLNKHKHGKTFMLILSIITMILYGTNKYYHYAPYITYHGLIRCLCFFFMGNFFQQKGWFQAQNLRKDIAIGSFTLLLSLILFYWHINENNFILHIALYYVVNLISIYAFIYLAKSLNNIKIRIITLISIGTMLIFGLHRILIGFIDFTIKTYAYQPEIITYQWQEATFISVSISLFLVPVIIVILKHCPILLGKKT